MAEKPVITPELLRQLLRYEPEAGKLFWKERPRELFNSQRAFAVWNARFANKLALNYKDKSGYLYGKIFKTCVQAHRAAWIIYYNTEIIGQIDHINHNTSDNRIINLRTVSESENKKNIKKRKDNKSGFTGVFWFKDRWLAKIKINNKKIHLGTFRDKDQAIAARASANIKYGFHENHGK